MGSHCKVEKIFNYLQWDSFENWDIINIYYYVCLRSTRCWLDALIYCSMIAIFVLASTLLGHITIISYISQCIYTYIRSDQISRSVVSDSLRPHESQHARPPCPTPTPGVHSDSCPSSQWCHPAISSSVVPFLSCPQSLPASESFPMSQLFAWGGQSTGVSALASFR